MYSVGKFNSKLNTLILKYLILCPTIVLMKATVPKKTLERKEDILNQNGVHGFSSQAERTTI